MLAFSLIAALAVADPACAHDPAAYFEQDAETFDQTEEGWRGLARQGCYAEAAELIAAYRDEARYDPQWGSGLIWHEGQMRAHAGENEAAADLMMQTRDADNPVMSAYVDASVAFLREDRDALLEAREDLLAVPEPPEFAEAVEQFTENFPDMEPPSWPLNLNIVDWFVACFEYDYATAYGGECEAALDD